MPRPDFCPNCGAIIESPQAIEWGGWRLDLGNGILLLDDKAIRLHFSEIKYLKTLIEAKGRTVGIASFAQEGNKSRDLKTLVRVQIYKLRKLLASLGYPKAIYMRHGWGYWLAERENARESV